jgi:hypothetical protein
MRTAMDVVVAARQFLGVRFAHQGRTRAGLDCLGLLMATAQALDLRFHGTPAHALDVPSYGTRPDMVQLKAKLEAHLLPVPKRALQPADILLLKIEGLPQHLALVSDYPIAGEHGMIHAYAPARAVIEHRYDPHWQRATYAAYRLPQLM